MLSICYGASIGRVGTLIGSPLNIILVGVVEDMYGVNMSFAQWMAYGLPLAVVFLLITWLFLNRIAFPIKIKEIPGGKDLINKEIQLLGKIGREEKAIASIFFLVALAWILRPFMLQRYIPSLNDGLIAIIEAIITFVIPVDFKKGEFLNHWQDAVKLPWGVLLLFGGGFPIALAFSKTGLAQWIGERLSFLGGGSILFIMLVVVAMVIFLTEITSNTATTSVMLPIMGALAYQ